MLGRVSKESETGSANDASPSDFSSGRQVALPSSPARRRRDHPPNFHALSPIRRDSSEVAMLPTMRIEAMRRAMLVMTTDHYFLCWPAWPIYSALVQHGLMQGTGCPDSNDETTSPREYLSLPEALQPTPLQLVTSHKRWIDRFPFPRLRDNLILLNGLVDLEDFVRDLFGMASLLLRSDLRRATWDSTAWTMGTGFAKKWGYLFL